MSPTTLTALASRLRRFSADSHRERVFGEIMDALHQARRGGLVASEAGWALQKALVEHLETVWYQADQGIWEVRGGRQQFTHSKVMAWVALDRTVRTAEEFGLDAPLGRWRALRARIHQEVCQRGFSPELGGLRAGIRVEDTRRQPPALAAGRIPSTDRPAGARGEGAFLACSFWLADNLLLQGRAGEARALFERLLAVRSDVGLLAEQYDPIGKRQLGNFPQAFSHLALVATAPNLARGAKPMEQRPVERA